MIKTERINYTLLNNSFKEKELIYPLSKRGFFSEINNLTQAILYCLEEKINLKICSKNWASGNWSDYFIPVFNEYSGVIPIPNDVFVLSRLDKICLYYHKRIIKRNVLQNDLWNKMHHESFTNKTFHFPELGIEGNILQAKKKIYEIIINYNDITLKTIKDKYETHKEFVAKSCGIHIRRGDKVFNKRKEAEFIGISNYIHKALNIDPNNTKFTICTDDYTVVNELRLEYPNFIFLTFCDKEKKGYDQKNYNNLQSKKKKSDEVISILLDSQILINSRYFIGTYTSNVSRYVAIVKNNIDCYSMDDNLNSH